MLEETPQDWKRILSNMNQINTHHYKGNPRQAPLSFWDTWHEEISTSHAAHEQSLSPDEKHFYLFFQLI